MHTIEIPEINKTLYMPQDLSECNQSQYIEMAHLLILNQTGELDYGSMRLHAIYKLLNIKRVEEVDETDKLTNLYLISELIDSFFDIDEQTKQKQIKLNFYECPIQKFNPLYLCLYGPKSVFNELLFGEYLDALRLYFQFNATPDIALLKALTAILLRSKKTFSSKRIAYNPDNVDNHTKNLKYAPVGVFYGVYLWFAAFQKFISSAQIPWAGKILDFSLLFDSDTTESKPFHDDIGMDGVFFALAENGPFGNASETKKTKAIEVLIKLYDMRIKQLNQQANDLNQPTP